MDIYIEKVSGRAIFWNRTTGQIGQSKHTFHDALKKAREMHMARKWTILRRWHDESNMVRAFMVRV
jgi:hypothetical protein